MLPTSGFHRAPAVACLVMILGVCEPAFSAGFVHIQPLGDTMGVKAVAHDSNTFVWSAADRGVCRFDGEETLCPIHRPAVALSAGPEHMWAALADGGILQVQGLSSRAWAYVEGEINSMVATASRVWVAGSQGLASIDARSPNKPPLVLWAQTPTIAARADHDGVLVAVGTQVFLLGLDGPPTLVAKVDNPVTAIVNAPYRGTVIIGTANGSLYEAAHNAIKPLLKSGRVTPALLSVAVDVEGNIWAGTLVRLQVVEAHPGALKGTDILQTLPHQQAVALDMDTAGNLWVATPSGLLRVRPHHPLRTFTPLRGFSSQVAFSVNGDDEGLVWAASGTGVTLWDGTSWTQNLPLRSGGPIYAPRTLAQDSHKQMWLGDMHSGVFKVERGQLVKQWPKPSHINQGVRALARRAEGGLWVGLAEGGLGSFDSPTFTTEFPPASPGRDQVCGMVETPEGLWLALWEDGLAMWRKGELRRYRRGHEIPPARVACLLSAEGIDMWVGTDGSGLLHLHDGHATVIARANGLPSDHILSLAEDGEGRVWMSSRNGVSAVSKMDLYEVVHGRKAKVEDSISFGFADAVPGEPVMGFPPSSYRDTSDTLWFPTLGGLLNVDPKAVAVKRAQPVIVFDDIQVNGIPVLSGAPAIKRATTFNVLFRFAVPLYDSRNESRLSYRLEGLEGEPGSWHESRMTRETRYQSVPPGKYRFVVQLRDGPAQVHRVIAQAQFELSLPQPLHAQMGFRLLALALLMGLVALAHRRRVQRIRAAHASVIEERTRIARDIHDSLQQDLVGLRFQIDAAALSLESDPKVTADHLARASELVSDGVTDLRDSIWSLRSSTFDTEELTNALRSRLERIAASGKVAIKVTATGEPQMLSAETAKQILQVTREAATNALKHAGASEILVVLKSSATEVSVSVSDNGRGMQKQDLSPAPQGAGQGMSSMKQRARSVGGNLNIESSVTHGTRITLTVPSTRYKHGQ